MKNFLIKRITLFLCIQFVNGDDKIHIKSSYQQGFGEMVKTIVRISRVDKIHDIDDEYYKYMLIDENSKFLSYLTCNSSFDYEKIDELMQKKEHISLSIVGYETITTIHEPKNTNIKHNFMIVKQFVLTGIP